VGFKFQQTRRAPTSQPTVQTRSVGPTPASVFVQAPPPPPFQVPSTVFFRHNQMSNPGTGSMFVRPARPLPAPQPASTTRDIGQFNRAPPSIHVEPPPVQIPQSLNIRHDQMSNPGTRGRQPLSAQTGALAPVTSSVSTVATRSTRYVTGSRSTTVTANVSVHTHLPVIRPHDPYDYSRIYEMAKKYARSNFSLEGSFYSQGQTYDEGDIGYENGGEEPSEGVRPILRMWPYNTSPYKTVGADQNYATAGPSSYDQYNASSYTGDASSYTGGPYTAEYSEAQVYANTDSGRIQENLQSLSIKEVPLSFVS
jgi:hypothetical protein